MGYNLRIIITGKGKGDKCRWRLSLLPPLSVGEISELVPSIHGSVCVHSHMQTQNLVLKRDNILDMFNGQGHRSEEGGGFSILIE